MKDDSEDGFSVAGSGNIQVDPGQVIFLSRISGLADCTQTLCPPLPQDLRMRDTERIAKMPLSLAHLLLHLPLLLTLISVGFYSHPWDLR